MRDHFRANLWLLVLSVLLCCILYPLALWAVGQTAFRHEANGSLIDRNGRPVTRPADAVGSRLVAQPFTGDGYFQPRPSAVAYNAAASGARNWAASNYQLRLRVALALGPIVKYGPGSPKRGRPVGADVEQWFRSYPVKDGKGLVARWAEAYPTAATTWVKDDKANTAYVESWQKSHAREVARWIADNPGTPEPKPEDLAVPFFASFAAEHPGAFPGLVEHQRPGGKTEKVVEPVTEGTDIQGYFFDMWLQEHPDADIEPVPADMVMASGSGLDPHITLANALYQLDRVAAKWAADTKKDVVQVRREIEEVLRQKAEAPLGGMVGVELVNVLEVNIALRNQFGTQAAVSR